jgi:hypothetical protein
MKIKKQIPFPFVLDELDGLTITTKAMFGCTAIYVEEKIVLILRDKTDHTNDNGVWLATDAQHHSSLRKIFPNMRSLELFGSAKETNWQNLPKDSDDFEESVIRACKLVRMNDPRVGRIPKPRKIKSKGASTGSRKKIR